MPQARLHSAESDKRVNAQPTLDVTSHTCSVCTPAQLSLSMQCLLTMSTLFCMLRAGGTQRLPRLIGRSKAKEMIFTGRSVGPEEALDIGVLHAF